MFLLAALTLFISPTLSDEQVRVTRNGDQILPTVNGTQIKPHIVHTLLTVESAYGSDDHDSWVKSRQKLAESRKRIEEISRRREGTRERMKEMIKRFNELRREKPVKPFKSNQIQSTL